jgi:anti-sigma factor RsiW
MMMDEELAALADGTLAPERRAAVLRRVAADPQLAAALAGQRAARAAIRVAVQEPASDALRSAVQAMAAQAPASGRPRRSGETARFARPLMLAAATATALVAVFAVLLGAGDPAGPSVAEAARAALAPARASAPAVRPGSSTLTVSIDGVSYPYWADSTGWRAVGARRDVLRGRTIRTVFYANGGRRIGYAIAAGAPLTVDGGQTVARDGVRMRVLRYGDAAIVTWLRAGHTCILAARGVDPEVLLGLAARQA